MLLDKIMLTAADVEEALQACFTSSHPYGKPLNVVDLGLIEQIVLVTDAEAPGSGIPGVPPRQSLRVNLVPPVEDDDAKAILLAQIGNRLAGLPQLSRFTLEWLDEQPWTEARISPRLRNELNPPFAILSNRKRT